MSDGDRQVCETVGMRTRLLPFCAVSCLLFAACSDDGDSSDTTTTSTSVAPVATAAPTTTAPTVVTTTTEPLVTEGATVIVANGNIIGGSAGRMSDTLGVAGFTVGTPTNGAEKVDDSIVYYTEADGAQAVAESLAAALGGVEALPMPDPIPTEDGTLDGGDVLLLLGNNQADRSLEELSGGGGDDGGDTEVDSTAAGFTIVVANANTIGGSAGRMSDQLETAGFTVGTPTNATSTITDSIVYYGDAAGAEDAAEALAEALGGLDVLALPTDVPTEDGSFGGDVLLMLGSAQADRTLAELAG